MARRYEIDAAFTASIKLHPKLGKVVTTSDFVRELSKRNHIWTCEQANEWIGRYQTFFRDDGCRDGDDKTFYMMNMGYVR